MGDVTIVRGVQLNQLIAGRPHTVGVLAIQHMGI